MAWSGLPPAAELGKLGVKRLSAGSSISAAVWGRTASLVKAFLSERSDALADEAMGYSAINRLFQ
jgi:hypothetical protein